MRMSINHKLAALSRHFRKKEHEANCKVWQNKRHELKPSSCLWSLLVWNFRKRTPRLGRRWTWKVHTPTISIRQLRAQVFQLRTEQKCFKLKKKRTYKYIVRVSKKDTSCWLVRRTTQGAAKLYSNYYYDYFICSFEGWAAGKQK